MLFVPFRSFEERRERCGVVRVGNLISLAVHLRCKALAGAALPPLQTCAVSCRGVPLRAALVVCVCPDRVVSVGRMRPASPRSPPVFATPGSVLGCAFPCVRTVWRCDQRQFVLPPRVIVRSCGTGRGRGRAGKSDSMQVGLSRQVLRVSSRRRSASLV
jgi:hypothetical protein